MMNPKEMLDHPTAKIVNPALVPWATTLGAHAMANGTHHTSRCTDDTVILFRTRSRHETLVTGNIANLYRAGAHVIYKRLAPVHVETCRAEELKIMHRVIRPGTSSASTVSYAIRAAPPAGDRARHGRGCDHADERRCLEIDEDGARIRRARAG